MRTWLVGAVIACCAGCVVPPGPARPALRGQLPQDPVAPAPAPAQGPEPQDEPAPRWELGASGLYYALRDEQDYFVPVVTADCEHLHLEARYQYEDYETGSAWAGWNFGLGEELRLDATLMGGVVAGQTQGVAPGFRVTLSYGPLDLFSEGEYLISTEDHTENFFYSWSELGVTPVDWLRGGLVAQRTKQFDSEPWVDRGLFLGVAVRDVLLTVYGFNLDDDERFWVFSVAMSF